MSASQQHNSANNGSLLNLVASSGNEVGDSPKRKNETANEEVTKANPISVAVFICLIGSRFFVHVGTDRRRRRQQAQSNNIFSLSRYGVYTRSSSADRPQPCRASSIFTVNRRRNNAVAVRLVHLIGGDYRSVPNQLGCRSCSSNISCSRLNHKIKIKSSSVRRCAAFRSTDSRPSK